MDSKRSTKDFTDSPLRSLSSFKDEIPGGEFPPSKDGDEDDADKSFQQKVQAVVNSSPFHITMILLVFVHCFILTAEMILTMEDVNADILKVLASTCLAILSFFLLEVTLRICSTGFKLLKKRLEVFDIAVVVTSIVLDVVVFAGNLGTEYKWTRALSYLIILRCWRLYGVYYAEVKKIHNDLRTDIEMAKYGRRQAETQADALQSERDAQLKEIFHLREFLRQHSLDPNFLVGDGMHSSSPVHDYHGYGRAVSIDRAETMREESRLYPAYSEESAISSIADDKHKQVTAAHNVAPPPHRESEEKESGRHSDEEEEEEEEEGTEIRSERSDDNSEYESAQDDDNVSGDGRDDRDNKESDHNDDRNREEEKVQEKEAEERNEITQKSKHNFEEGMEVKVERDVKVQGSGYRDSLISEGGIDNPAFEGDDTLQDEDSPSSPPSHHHHHHEEHSQSYKESPSKESAQLEGRSRTESDLAYVTEDVNGIPMTSL